MAITPVHPISVGCSQPSDSAVGSTSEPYPEHLDYVTEDFRSLYEAGIVDAEGDALIEQPLPPLLEEELHLIQTDYNTPIKWKFGDGKSVSFTFWKLMQDVLGHQINPDSLTLQSITTLSPYAFHVLTTQTDYPRRVYAALGIEDLYVPRKTALPRAKPSQIVRTEFKCATGILGFRRQAALSLSRLYLAEHYPPDQITNRIEEAIYQEVYTEITQYPIKNTSQNVFVFFPFEGPVQWMAYSKLQRSHLFSTDDLYIPVETLFAHTLPVRPVIPLSHQRKPTRSFFHGWLGVLKAEESDSIDENGWGYFVNEQIQGVDLGQSGLDKELIQKANRWNLEKEIKKWAEKYQNPEATFAFLMATYLLAKDTFTADELHEILLNALLTHTQGVKDPLFKVLFTLLAEKKIPFEIVCAFLQFSGFLQEMQRDVSSHAVSFQIGTYCFQHPTLKCFIGSQAIPIRLEPRKALETLLHFQSQEPARWERVEGDLTALFLSIYTPSQQAAAAKEALSKTLFFEELDHVALTCLENPSPLLIYLGLGWILSSPYFSSRRKVELTELHLHQLLPLVREKEAFRSQLKEVMDVNTLPNLTNSKSFLFKWIKFLIQNRRGSENSAYTLWKQLEKEPQFLNFSFELIQSLTSSKPDFALRLFSYLRSHKHLQRASAHSVQKIFSCKAGVEDVSTHSQSRLMAEMGLTLLELIEDPSFQPSKDKIAFTNAIDWFCERMREEGLRAEAEQLSLYCEEHGLFFQTKKERAELPSSSSSSIVFQSTEMAQEEEKIKEEIKAVEEVPSDPYLSLRTLRDIPNPTEDEIKEAIQLYNRGVTQKSFSKEESLDLLCFLIQKASPEKIYTLAKPSKGKRRQQKNQVQGKGLMANLITALNGETLNGLNASMRKTIRETLTLRLLEITLDKKDKGRVLAILSQVTPQNEDLETKIAFMGFCLAKGFCLTGEAKTFWLQTLREWHARGQEEESGRIQVFFLKGMEWGFQDPAFAKLLEEGSKNSLRETLVSDLKLLIQKTSLTAEEVGSALEKCQRGMREHLFSIEEEIFFLSRLLREVPQTQWVLEALLDRLQESDKVAHVDPSAPTHFLSSLLEALQAVSVKNKLRKKALSTLFTHFFPYLSTEDEKRAFILFCAQKNLSIGDSIAAKDFWLKTVKAWYLAAPQECQTLYSCYSHGKRFGFEDPDLFYSLLLGVVNGAVSHKLPIKIEWIESLVEGFPLHVSREFLEKPLLYFFESQEIAIERKVMLIEQLSLKDDSLPDLFICPLVESVGQTAQEDFRFLSQWFISTNLFENPPVRNGLRAALETLLERSEVSGEEQWLQPEAVAIAIKYFDDLDRMNPEFWEKCYIQDYLKDRKAEKGILERKCKEATWDWFIRLSASNRLLSSPSILQKLYSHIFIVLKETEDGRLLEFLDHFEKCEPLFAAGDQPMFSFYTCYQLLIGCCFLLKEELRENGLTEERAQRIANLGLVREQLFASYLKVLKKEEAPHVNIRDLRSRIGACNMQILQLLFASKKPEFVSEGYHILSLFTTSRSDEDRFVLTPLQHVNRESAVFCDGAWELVEALFLAKDFDYRKEAIDFLNQLIRAPMKSFAINYVGIYAVLARKPTSETLFSILHILRSYLNIELSKLSRDQLPIDAAFTRQSWAMFAHVLPFVLKDKNVGALGEAMAFLKELLPCFLTNDLAADVLYPYVKTVLVEFSWMLSENFLEPLQEVIKLALKHYALTETDNPLIAFAAIGLLKLSRLNYDRFFEQGSVFWLMLLENELTNFPNYLKDLATSFVEALIKDLDGGHPFKERMLKFIERRIYQLSHLIAEEKLESIKEHLAQKKKQLSGQSEKTA